MILSSQFKIEPVERSKILFACNGAMFDVSPDILNNLPLLKLMTIYHDEPCFEVIPYAKNPALEQPRLEELCDKYLGDPLYFGKVISVNDLTDSDVFMLYDTNHQSVSVKADFYVDPSDTVLLERWALKMGGLIGAVERHFSLNPVLR